ncbi:MAG: H-X9-DG-CTERM domain-containing protein [Pirellulales bacterium]
MGSKCATAPSYHSGIVHVALMDGSV